MKVTQELLLQLDSRINRIFSKSPIFCGSTALNYLNLIDREVRDIDIILTYENYDQLTYLRGVLHAVAEVCSTNTTSSASRTINHNSFSAEFNREHLTIDVWLLNKDNIKTLVKDCLIFEEPSSIIKAKLHIGRKKDYADLLYMMQNNPTETIKIIKKLEEQN